MAKIVWSAIKRRAQLQSIVCCSPPRIHFCRLLTIYLRQFTSALLIYLGLPRFTWDYLFWRGQVNCREVNKVTLFYLAFTTYSAASTTSPIVARRDPSTLGWYK